MAENKYTVTDWGRAAMAQALSDKETTLTITRIATTDADLSGVDLTALQDLQGDKRFFGIMSNTHSSDGTTKIECIVTNVGLTADYKITGVGVYARINNGDERLFAVNAGLELGTMPALSRTNVVKTYRLRLFFKFDNAASINVQVDMDVYVTRSECLNACYPVGAVVLNDGSFNPADEWGGVWEAISGKYLMTSGKYNGQQYNAKDIAGWESRKMLLTEMPKHSHTRGSMNITGSLPLPTHTGRWDRYVTGAFHTEGGNGGSVTRTVEGADFDEDKKWHDITYSWFNAADAWTGSTSISGGGEAMPIMPRCFVVDGYRRVA